MLQPRNILRAWLPLAAFAILWADLIRQLSYTWSTNEQYAYGWFVPILALSLFWKKWPTRPAAGPMPADHGTGTTDLSTAGPQTTAHDPKSEVCSQRPIASSPLFTGLIFLAALALLPLRMVHEINQDWSTVGFLLTLSVVVLSLCAVYLMGAWPWVKHFAFPICFILVAVNWPYRIENSLKHRLMGAAAGLTVEIIGWLGVPAVQHGNMIELATCSVGVEDACSGIRSLQSTIMAAWFLGELYLLKWPHRFLLLAVGMPLAFCFNIVRTLFLTWQASSAGETAIAKWHGSAGMTISVACLSCLWLIAVFLAKRAMAKQDQETTGPLSTDHRPLTTAGNSLSAGGEGRGEVAVPNSQLSTLNSPPSALSPQPLAFSLQPLPRRFLLACGLWSLCIIALTEAWYRAHDTDPAQTVRWSAQFPTNFPSARQRPINKEISQILRCDQGSDFSWEEQNGSKWSAFFFRWRAGEATSRMAARDHRPEICLPSRGYKVKSDLGIHFLPAHGLELPFRSYIFEDAGRVLYVFFCLWEDGADKQTGLGRSKYLDRLDSVLAGRRRLGQQTLEIVVSGYVTMKEAEQAVRQRLPSLIQVGERGAQSKQHHLRKFEQML